MGSDSAAPVAVVVESCAPVPWYESQQFKALWQASLITVITWLAAALVTNDWTWKPTLSALLSNMVIILKDWFSPTIIAPIPQLNRKNVP